MGFLDGKNGLVFGVANDRSIATGIAQACHAQGARIGYTHLPGEKMERRVRQAVEELDPTFLVPCDVSDDQQIQAAFAAAKEQLGQIDFLVHSLAFADRKDLTQPFYQTSREGFRLALDVSAYSLVAVTRELMNVQPEGNCSVMTMSYLGAERAVPKYNVMGVAKAALEAVVRYLALDLGSQNVRVNGISAGPIKTLAAMAVGDFGQMLDFAAQKAPLQRNVDQDEVGKTGVYLASDLSSGVTGEVIYVDAGYNIVGL